ncbi:MAG: hypothetical protein AAGH78_17995 [Cyanobacteria bacterium P01_H01_bin.58]
MVVLGIGVMFYGPGLLKQCRRLAKSATPTTDTPEANAPNE